MDPTQPIYSSNSQQQEAVFVRFIATAEGIAFCSISTGGGAFTAKPGEVISIKLTPQFHSVPTLSPQPYHNSLVPGLSLEVFKGSEDSQ